MPNKLTVLIDGGFLLVSRACVLEKGFATSNSAAQKNATAKEFKEILSQTLAKILNQIPEADNIVLMSEGGSWRKNLPIPKQLSDTTYKGHREKHIETDWNAIYKAYNEFAKNCEAAGITCSQHSAIEGDDWAWYWSRRLNAEGTSCLIWSSDCDLKQLVQDNCKAFTCWYNDRTGLVMPESMAWSDDPVEAMLNPPFYSAVSQALTRRFKKCTYINPDLIVINKILCGDAGDNIKSVIRYKKGSRTYRFADSDYKKFIERTGLTTVKDFLNNTDLVYDYISSQSKFKPYGFVKENIDEMLEYNTSLVWLNEAVIPDPVTKAMVQFEYKQFDVSELKHNSRMLADRSTDIENIFAGINL